MPIEIGQIVARPQEFPAAARRRQFREVSGAIFLKARAGGVAAAREKLESIAPDLISLYGGNNHFAKWSARLVISAGRPLIGPTDERSVQNRQLWELLIFADGPPAILSARRAVIELLKAMPRHAARIAQIEFLFTHWPAVLKLKIDLWPPAALSTTWCQPAYNVHVWPLFATAELVFLVHISPGPTITLYSWFFSTTWLAGIYWPQRQIYSLAEENVKTDPGVWWVFCLHELSRVPHGSMRRPDKAIKRFNVCVWSDGETPFWCTRLLSMLRGKPQIYSNLNPAFK